MRKIKIGNRSIGEGEPCFVIAEAGSNHNRDFKQALKLIDVAVEAGADAVKFQTYSRDTEEALGDGIKKVQFSEEENFRLGRKSLHAACNIKAGNEIKREMLTIKRPGLGIKPKYEDVIIDRTAKVNIEADQWISWEMV